MSSEERLTDAEIDLRVEALCEGITPLQAATIRAIGAQARLANRPAPGDAIRDAMLKAAEAAFRKRGVPSPYDPRKPHEWYFKQEAEDLVSLLLPAPPRKDG